MKSATLGFVSVLLAGVASSAFALETFPASDPRSVVQTVIELTDHHGLPSWSEPAFFVKARPYVTSELFAILAKGGKIAAKKQLNIWDGDIFTGAQMVEHARLFGATVMTSAGDAATVDASIGTTDDPKTEPKEGGHSLFQVKREGGVWKIDDIKSLEDYAKTLPSLKTTFSDPVRYAQ